MIWIYFSDFTIFASQCLLSLININKINKKIKKTQNLSCHKGHETFPVQSSRDLLVMTTLCLHSPSLLAALCCVNSATRDWSAIWRPFRAIRPFSVTEMGQGEQCPTFNVHSETGGKTNRKEGNVLFNDALNTFYLRL